MRLSMERLTIRRNSGDPCGCAKCRGKLVVTSTRIDHEQGVRVRYLGCDVCHWRPDDKIIIPLVYAPPRAAKKLRA